MRYCARAAVAGGLILLLSGGIARVCSEVTVTINPSLEFQTIEGFGAHGSMDVWWSSGPFYNTQFLDLIVDNLGFTMNRNEFYPTFEPTNENNDPNNLDMTRFNYNAEFGTKQVGWITALRDKAARSGEPIRFIVSYWSPPAWMKVNNSTVGGNPTTNVLRTGMENELAEFGVATVRAYKERCNVDLYALSMQNEPAFDEPYNSCVYTAERYRDVFKIFAARVKAAYPNVKMFGPEDMLERWNVSGAFPGPLMADTVSRRLMDAVAVHGYSDGVHPTPVSRAASLWRTVARNLAPLGKPVWMTETSGYFDTWDDAFKVAEAIYVALRYGRLSAWVWWQLSEPSSNEYAMMASGQPGKRAYVHKHYARYIRPDAIAIGDTVVGDTLVFSVAFRHKQHRTLTIILLNANSSSRTVTIAGPAMPTFTVYRSTATENCANVGTATTSVTLPAMSLVTLYGQNYDPPTPVVDPITGKTNFAGLVSRGDARIYTLDGRFVTLLRDVRLEGNRVQWASDGKAARGTYYAELVDRTGTVSHTRLPVDLR